LRAALDPTCACTAEGGRRCVQRESDSTRTLCGAALPGEGASAPAPSCALASLGGGTCSSIAPPLTARRNCHGAVPVPPA
jgi:hypothetical protein